MPSAVTTTPPAPGAEALAHFESLLRYETDCADVHGALAGGGADFVLVDVRGAAAFRVGRIPGAINIAHADITAARLEAWPKDTVFVTYCAGPHCNGAQRGAIRFAALGRPVKVMVGGLIGWNAEGFRIESDPPIMTRGDGE